MNSRSAFVAVGLAVNLLVLLRGVLFLGVLGNAHLGVVALVQGVILLAGMLHFGLLNGGYRLLCHVRARARQRIVDLAYACFLALGAAMLLGALAAAAWVETPGHRAVALLAGIGGIATLVKTWMFNEMIAQSRLGPANRLNAISILASLGLLLFLPVSPVLFAVGSIVAQPLVFALLAPLSGSVLLPRSLRLSRRLALVIARAGFPLFLTGLAVQFNTFADRTYVAGELGLEALGRLYLALLFVNLFQMVPNLVQQAYLPAIVRAFSEREAALVTHETRMLFAWLAAYCLTVVLALWLLAEPLTGLLLPGRTQDLRFVYLLAPGLILFTLSGPFAIVFNVTIRYGWMIAAYGLGTAVTVATLGGAWALGEPLALDAVAALRSVSYTLTALALVVGWAVHARRLPEFRWLGGRRDAADAA
jgi:O-antigen/teichoic acid export membrane protein